MRLALVLCLAVFAVACWGSAVPQAPTCAAWVSCTRALDARDGRSPADLLRFEEGGFCWNNPLLAEGCLSACERGLERLREREASLPGECAP